MLSGGNEAGCCLVVLLIGDAAGLQQTFAATKMSHVSIATTPLHVETHTLAATQLFWICLTSAMQQSYCNLGEELTDKPALLVTQSSLCCTQQCIHAAAYAAVLQQHLLCAGWQGAGPSCVLWGCRQRSSAAQHWCPQSLMRRGHAGLTRSQLPNRVGSAQILP